MKQLIAGLSVHGVIDKAEAKRAAFALISLLQSKVKSGDQIDLGFMTISLKSVPPRMIKCNIGGKKGEELFIGESRKWETRVYKAWQKQTRPDWSRWS